MAMRRVEVYSYKVLNQVEFDSPMLQRLSTNSSPASTTNFKMYASHELALTAANHDSDRFAVAIEIIKQMATLPEHQILQLQRGLSWSSEIPVSINLQEVEVTRISLRE